MKCKFLLVCGLLLSVLSGCATPYQPIKGTGGYYHTRLAENVYSITFEGNGFTSYEQAYNYAFQRACEIGIDLGYKYMAIEGQDDCTRSSVVNMGSSSYSSGSAYGYGNSAFYSGTTTTYNNSVPVQKPGVVLIVKYFENQPTEKYLDIISLEKVLAGSEGTYCEDKVPLLGDLPLIGGMFRAPARVKSK